ncbi:uncharacterized protein RBU33_026839 isoform 2-T2 [Hipposideros larvatus]
MLGNWGSVVRELLSSKPEVITQLEQGAEPWMEVQEVPSCTYLCRCFLDADLCTLSTAVGGFSCCPSFRRFLRGTPAQLEILGLLISWSRHFLGLRSHITWTPSPAMENSSVDVPAEGRRDSHGNRSIAPTGRHKSPP